MSEKTRTVSLRCMFGFHRWGVIGLVGGWQQCDWYAGAADKQQTCGRCGATRPFRRGRR